MENEIPEEYLMKDTPYSTRNQNGVITLFDSFEEALTDFLGYEGYRLSVTTNTNEVHIYRDELPEMNNAQPGSLAYDNPSGRVTYMSQIVLQRKH